jgi:Holliday junction resolvasome RuvABC endonuclease subunit
MQKEPPRILAVNPGSRYIGWAAFRESELLDWGVRVIRAKTRRGKLKAAKSILTEAIDRFHPDTLATKRLHGSRSSRCLNDLARSISALAKQRKLRCCQYSIEQVKRVFCPEAKTNKRRLAELVAAMYPVLRHELQKELANRNPYYLRMFEAVALGVVCHEQLDQQ